MKRARVLFLWHMHQPSYLDPATGSLSMPWVRMHAVRGYLDMARIASELGLGAAQTFNFTPCLLDQLEGLGSGRVLDDVRVLCEKPTDTLLAGERELVLRHFFSVGYEQNVKPLPRYAALLHKRGPDAESVDFGRALSRFSTAELRDVQVFFHLAWLGHTARHDDPNLRALLDQGGSYGEDDKAYVLSAYDRIVAGIIPAYRALAEAGAVELSTTPYYHPILPLLIDSDAAARARPDRKLPPRFSWPADAREHVRRAAATHGVRFGARPRGMWPAEGSVSPEVVPLFEDAGLDWIATDEAVLFRSLPADAPRTSLYRPWRVPGGEERLACFFRDHGLSDLLGFTYYKMSPAQAAADFVGHVETIARSMPDGEVASIAVILDGENPWEHYPKSGYDHLRAIFEALQKSALVETSTFSRALAEHEAGETRPELLPRLHTGSWIESSFKIWIGGEEENRAWALLGETAARVQAAGDEPRGHAAHEHLLAAEGSDWFWWYGDDFATDQKAEFDRLFRARLTAAYQALGFPEPAALHEPIARLRPVRAERDPVGPIAPSLGGGAVEWLAAGRVTLTASRQAMHGGAGVARFKAMLFGSDGARLFVRLVPASDGWRDGLRGASLRVVLRGPQGHEVHESTLLDPRPEGGAETGLAIALGTGLELSAPLARVARATDQVAFALVVLPSGAVGERSPASGFVSLRVPEAGVLGSWSA